VWVERTETVQKEWGTFHQQTIYKGVLHSYFSKCHGPCLRNDSTLYLEVRDQKKASLKKNVLLIVLGFIIHQEITKLFSR